MAERKKHKTPKLSPQFFVDRHGKKVSVLLTMKDFEHILEELEDIRRYDQAKAGKDEHVPIKQAFKIIESRRKKK